MEGKKKQISIHSFMKPKSRSSSGREEVTAKKSRGEKVVTNSCLSSDDEENALSIREEVSHASSRVDLDLPSTTNTGATVDRRSNLRASLKTFTEPYQPHTGFTFPATCEGGAKKKKRSFQASWFEKFSWLHYDVANDAAFCFNCVRALEKKQVLSDNIDPAFVTQGYRDWKHALERGDPNKLKKAKGFHKHEESKIHKDATEMISITAKSANVSALLSSEYDNQRKANRQNLLKIISNIRYLARQSLPFRGNWKDETHSEFNSNFHQLLLLRAEDDPSILVWIKRESTLKYTSPEMQNEILKCMALGMMRGVVSNIQKAGVYVIMADETADVSNIEQLVICLRWVDDDLQAHEEFIGMKPIPDTKANTIVREIKDVLLRMNLRIEEARGACFDGAATMAGAKTGVATQLKSLNAKIMFTHCYGHALNLVVKDACSKVDCLKESFEIVHEICKLVKKSPKRDNKLHELREESGNQTTGIHDFCPTRWTVRGSSLGAVMNNHAELLDLWDFSLDSLKDTEMKARVIGAQTNMTKFSFCFGCLLGERVLRKTDILSKALQGKSISAAEGQLLASDVVSELEVERTSQRFDCFWEVALQKTTSLEVDEPNVPRKRKRPGRFGDGDNHHIFTSVKEFYSKKYFEVYDYVISGIRDRFNQKDYAKYVRMENVLIGGFNRNDVESNLEYIGRQFEGDIDTYRLQTELTLLPRIAESANKKVGSINIADTFDILRSAGVRKVLIPEVIKLAKLIMLMPATNATSERSFSALKRLKTYVRSSMGHSRLNNLMFIHIHQDRTDNMDLKLVANDFIKNKEEFRKNIFALF